MNLIENNKLIAGFLKKKYYDDCIVIHNGAVCTSNPSGELWAKCRYHSDWNWLMEVVEKIESLEENNNLMDCFKQSNKVCGLPIYTKIEAVYNACIEFIKWYNLNK